MPPPLQLLPGRWRPSAGLPARSRLANQIAAGALSHCAGHERFFAQIEAEGAQAERQLRDAVISGAKSRSCSGVDMDAL